MRASPLSMRVHARDSLLIPCSKATFADFGQNPMLLGAKSKNSLLFSLLLENLAFARERIAILLHLLPLRIQCLLRGLSLPKVLAHCRQKRLGSLRRPNTPIQDIPKADVPSVKGARIA
jgi:hypothetical protein